MRNVCVISQLKRDSMKFFAFSANQVKQAELILLFITYACVEDGEISTNHAQQWPRFPGKECQANLGSQVPIFKDVNSARI